MNNTDLLIYRNELKNRKIAKYKIIGILSDIILSLDFTELKEFISKITNVKCYSSVDTNETVLLRIIDYILHDKIIINKKELTVFINNYINKTENK